MEQCWACGKYIRYAPEITDEEEEQDIEVTCSECLTRHIYTENEDGNLVVSQAITADGTVLHRPKKE